MAITLVDKEKFITLRPGEERASHNRGRKPLKEFGDDAGSVLLFDISPSPALLVLAYMGRPRKNRPVIGDENNFGWVEG